MSVYYSLISQVVSLVSVEEWERKALLGETSETSLKSSGVDGWRLFCLTLLRGSNLYTEFLVVLLRGEAIGLPCTLHPTPKLTWS